MIKIFSCPSLKKAFSWSSLKEILDIFYEGRSSGLIRKKTPQVFNGRRPPGNQWQKISIWFSMEEDILVFLERRPPGLLGKKKNFHSMKEDHLSMKGLLWNKTSRSSMKEYLHLVFYERRYPSGLIWKKTSIWSSMKEDLPSVPWKKTFFWWEKISSRCAMAEDIQAYYGRRPPPGHQWQKDSSRSSVAEEFQVFYDRGPIGLLRQMTSSRSPVAEHIQVLYDRIPPGILWQKIFSRSCMAEDLSFS